MSYVGTKFEYRPAPKLKKHSGIPLLRENSKQSLIPKFKTDAVGTLGIRIWDLFRNSDLGFRIFELWFVILIFAF
jgi:hypothetical protein